MHKVRTCPHHQLQAAVILCPSWDIYLFAHLGMYGVSYRRGSLQPTDWAQRGWILGMLGRAKPVNDQNMPQLQQAPLLVLGVIYSQDDVTV